MLYKITFNFSQLVEIKANFVYDFNDYLHLFLSLLANRVFAMAFTWYVYHFILQTVLYFINIKTNV